MTRLRWTRTILLVLVIVVIILAVYYLHSPNFQPVRTVLVNGTVSDANKELLINTTKSLFNKKNFFTANINDIKSQLQSFPWVANATVHRQWPETIVINLQSPQPQARWNQKGLVNRYGEVFYPKSSKPLASLPDFFGPNNQSALMMLAQYQQIEQKLAPLSLKITKIDLSSDGSWDITLNNGMNLQLGKTDILTRTDYFVKVYPQVFSSTKKRAKSVDLRYKNGMAVAWEK